ncbi:hypothetical protein DL93DRAFT_969673 [Clavulina sp. PMI_390]|nr:hypothetical protein DL93DRAFT_969673 [Clavulina sp. PMI_390]
MRLPLASIIPIDLQPRRKISAILNTPMSNHRDSDSDDSSDNESIDWEKIPSKLPHMLLEFGVTSEDALQGLSETEKLDLLHRVHDDFQRQTANSVAYVNSLRLLQDLCYYTGNIPNCFRLEDVNIDRSQILGQGGEATVFGGTMGGSNVAGRLVLMSAKEWRGERGRRVRGVSAPISLAKSMLMPLLQLVYREAITHSQLHHPNILRFLGIYEAVIYTPMVILPLYERGSLKDLLEDTEQLLDLAAFRRMVNH